MAAVLAIHVVEGSSLPPARRKNVHGRVLVVSLLQGGHRKSEGRTKNGLFGATGRAPVINDFLEFGLSGDRSGAALRVELFSGPSPEELDSDPLCTALLPLPEIMNGEDSSESWVPLTAADGHALGRVKFRLVVIPGDLDDEARNELLESFRASGAGGIADDSVIGSDPSANLIDASKLPQSASMLGLVRVLVADARGLPHEVGARPGGSFRVSLRLYPGNEPELRTSVKRTGTDSPSWGEDFAIPTNCADVALLLVEVRNRDRASVTAHPDGAIVGSLVLPIWRFLTVDNDVGIASQKRRFGFGLVGGNAQRQKRPVETETRSDVDSEEDSNESDDGAAPELSRSSWLDLRIPSAEAVSSTARSSGAGQLNMTITFDRSGTGAISRGQGSLHKAGASRIGGQLTVHVMSGDGPWSRSVENVAVQRQRPDIHAGGDSGEDTDDDGTVGYEEDYNSGGSSTQACVSARIVELSQDATSEQAVTGPGRAANLDEVGAQLQLLEDTIPLGSREIAAVAASSTQWDETLELAVRSPPNEGWSRSRVGQLAPLPPWLELRVHVQSDRVLNDHNLKHGGVQNAPVVAKCELHLGWLVLNLFFSQRNDM